MEEFIQEKKADMLEIRENVPEVLPWVMNNYLEKFDKSLVDTNSKINKTPENYIEPKLRITYDDDNSDRGTGCSGDGTTITVHTQEEAPTGEALADFSDKFSNNMLKASEKMKTINNDSDSDAENDKFHAFC